MMCTWFSNKVHLSSVLILRNGKSWTKNFVTNFRVCGMLQASWFWAFKQESKTSLSIFPTNKFEPETKCDTVFHNGLTAISLDLIFIFFDKNLSVEAREKYKIRKHIRSKVISTQKLKNYFRLEIFYGIADSKYPLYHHQHTSSLYSSFYHVTA